MTLNNRMTNKAVYVGFQGLKILVHYIANKLETQCSSTIVVIQFQLLAQVETLMKQPWCRSHRNVKLMMMMNKGAREGFQMK